MFVMFRQPHDISKELLARAQSGPHLSEREHKSGRDVCCILGPLLADIIFHMEEKIKCFNKENGSSCWIMDMVG